jgi:hypothetical protein
LNALTSGLPTPKIKMERAGDVRVLAALPVLSSANFEGCIRISGEFISMKHKAGNTSKRFLQSLHLNGSFSR